MKKPIIIWKNLGADNTKQIERLQKKGWKEGKSKWYSRPEHICLFKQRKYPTKKGKI